MEKNRPEKKTLTTVAFCIPLYMDLVLSSRVGPKPRLDPLVKQLGLLMQFFLHNRITFRGGGTGGAGGAIAPPTFVILLSNQPLAPPTILVGSVNSSTTNFSYLPPPLMMSWQSQEL